MLNIIKSSLNANMRGISLVSNNIANSNTTAFKKSYSNFSDIYSKNISDNPKAFSGMGVINDTPRKQMFQGPLKQTDGALDLAVSGLGFLTLGSTNNFENRFYTRDGSLGLSSNGEVVNQQGLNLLAHPVVDDTTYNPAILDKVTIPPNRTDELGNNRILTNVNVSSSGVLKAVYGLDEEVVIAKIPLTSFESVESLNSEGNNLFKPTVESGEPVVGIALEKNMGEIIPGFLEGSNVEITDELVKMLKYQQAYSGNSRLLQTEIDVTKRLIENS